MKKNSLKHINLKLTGAAALLSCCLTGCALAPSFVTPEDFTREQETEILSWSEEDGENETEQLLETEGESGGDPHSSNEVLTEAADSPSAPDADHSQSDPGASEASIDETQAADPKSSSSSLDTSGAFSPARYIPGVFHLIPGYFLAQELSLPAPDKNLAALEYRLDRLLSSYDGLWSACVKDLSTGETCVINDVPMPSASIMKLFILGCVDDEIRFGRLERTPEITARIANMIEASSNQDANQLLLTLGGGDYAAGIDRLNQYIQNSGYSSATVAYNPFQDTAHILDGQHMNQTSAADCASLLERIYHRTFGTRTACEEAEELLLAQDTRYKLPSALPDMAMVGNKTGETDEIENDAAVVYTTQGDYILTVFSTRWTDKAGAQDHFQDISALVWSYFTDPEFTGQTFPLCAQAQQTPPEAGLSR